MVVVGCRPDVITCNILIDGLCKTGKISVAIKLLEEMGKENKESGVICRPDAITYSTVIDDRIGGAREMISEGIKPNVIIYNTLLIDLFLKANVKDARNLVGKTRLNGVLPNSWTYNIFIDGLCKKGCVFEVVEMLNTLVNNKFAISLESLNSLVDGLCKIGRFKIAWDLFQDFSLCENLVPNIVTYSILINGLCKTGQLEKANKLLSYMEEKGCAPNVVTFTMLIFGFLKNNEIPKVVDLLRKMAKRNVKPIEFIQFLKLFLEFSFDGYDCFQIFGKQVYAVYGGLEAQFVHFWEFSSSLHSVRLVGELFGQAGVVAAVI
ncbi:pentatricopeptide repeat-containing protein At1g09820-like [Pistacia vera]|uniref:pentatricopeptide repeat-containing protein At1g09820-like n=1 Tax=Pistacia vera TaxID=55513 RepID=UPI001263A913|nr:pentatricopeptide repeat-containing protein At1g09820-like [Pistacia vera]